MVVGLDDITAVSNSTVSNSESAPFFDRWEWLYKPGHFDWAENQVWFISQNESDQSENNMQVSDWLSRAWSLLLWTSQFRVLPPAGHISQQPVPGNKLGGFFSQLSFLCRALDWRKSDKNFSLSPFPWSSLLCHKPKLVTVVPRNGNCGIRLSAFTLGQSNTSSIPQFSHL